MWRECRCVLKWNNVRIWSLLGQNIYFIQWYWDIEQLLLFWKCESFRKASASNIQAEVGVQTFKANLLKISQFVPHVKLLWELNFSASIEVIKEENADITCKLLITIRYINTISVKWLQNWQFHQVWFE